MKATFIAALLACGGCGSWTAAQLELVGQVERGVAAAARSAEAGAELIDAAAENRRALLDAAFDADVRDRGAADPEWVIEARQGYAAGLDLLAEQRRRLDAARQADARNAEAARRAARRLRQMLELQARLLPGELPLSPDPDLEGDYE